MSNISKLTKQRGYQYGFSKMKAGNYDVQGREKKAKTMLAVLADQLPRLDSLTLLNVGGSSGIIDNYLADYFKSVTSIDIDNQAIESARARFKKNNLKYMQADAMQLPFADNSIDVVINSQVYEHVPDANRMFSEINRVLKKRGVCYFAAGNRLMYNEPHYNLRLLSILPRPLAHLYIRLAGKGNHYYEKHLTYWGLKRMVKQFEIIDYTKKLISNPDDFSTRYMLPKGSRKEKTARLVSTWFYWALPGYIWVLRKS